MQHLMFIWPCRVTNMIRCISKYASSLGAFAPGDTITVPALAAALLADSPGSFVLIDERAEAQDASDAEAVKQAAPPDALPIVSKPARGYRRKG